MGAVQDIATIALGVIIGGGILIVFGMVYENYFNE